MKTRFTVKNRCKNCRREYWSQNKPRPTPVKKCKFCGSTRTKAVKARKVDV